MHLSEPARDGDDRDRRSNIKGTTGGCGSPETASVKGLRKTQEMGSNCSRGVYGGRVDGYCKSYWSGRCLTLLNNAK